MADLKIESGFTLSKLYDDYKAGDNRWRTIQSDSVAKKKKMGNILTPERCSGNGFYCQLLSFVKVQIYYCIN